MAVKESLEYEDIQTETKLEDCALKEVRNMKVGIKYATEWIHLTEGKPITCH